MNKATRRMAALMMAVMMVFLAGRFPVRAAETYTITLYGNGGYCIDDENKKQESIALDVSAGTVLTTDDNCGNVSWQSSDPNLGFAGWADAAGTEYGSSDTFTVNGNAELYAIWEDLVDNAAFTTAIADGSSEENAVPAGESTESVPSAPGSESTATVFAPAMLAAAPAQTTHTIVADGNGGFYVDANGAQQTSITLTYNDTDMYTLSESFGGVEWKHSDPHMRLTGWNDSAGNFYSIYDYASKDASQDETFTAEWETCNLITFDSGSQTAHFDYDDDTPSTVTIKYAVDDTLGYNVGEPINTDAVKVFYGWDTDGDGVMDMSDYYGFAPSGDMTITAVWADKITITFDPQGGSYFDSGTYVTTPYVYEGSSADWYSLASVKPYLHHSTSALAGWAYDQAGSSMVTDDVTYTDVNGKTLYAVWAKDVYTLTYDANGGAFTGTVSGTQAYDRIPATETWPTAQVTTDGHEDPERSGYEFGGWAMDPDGKEPFRNVWGESSRNASMPETGDITVYAIWKNLSEITDSTYQGAANITWIREATVPVMQIDHQTAAPDQVLVNGTALTASQYVATVTKDADGKDVVIIELTEAYKSTLTDDAKIEAVYASETFDGTVYPENISYATLEVENGSQTVEGEATADSLKPVVITVSGQAANVQSVGVDGTILDQKDYTVTAGSAIITLLEEYLATLPAGEDEHEVTVTFKDGGIATASFSVVTTVPEEQPEPAADESSAEESTVEESSAEESNTEESSTEESAAEESGTGDSKPEDSKTEESKAEESKPEESKPAESSADEPSPVVPSGSPKTGDPGYLIWVIAIAASGVVLALLLVFLLKKRRK